MLSTLDEFDLAAFAAVQAAFFRAEGHEMALDGHVQIGNALSLYSVEVVPDLTHHVVIASAMAAYGRGGRVHLRLERLAAEGADLDQIFFHDARQLRFRAVNFDVPINFP